MEYIYASLLLHSAGKEVSEENIKKLLEVVGIQVDEVRVKMLVAALKEVNIDEVIKQATMTPMPAVATPVPATPAQQPTQQKAPAAETKEEEKKEVSEEEIAEGIASLFG